MNQISYLPAIVFILYTFSSLFYLFQLIFRRSALVKIGQKTVWIGFVLQVLFWGVHFFQNGSLFLSESKDAYLFSGFVLSGIFLLICLKVRFDQAGILFLPIVLILFLIARFSNQNYITQSGWIYSHWAPIHIVCSFLSFTVFFLSFGLGLLFLFQEFQIKKHRIGFLFSKLPSLELLEQMHMKALTIGLILLTIGIVTGAGWAKSAKGVYFFDDPRQLWTIVSWLIYALFFQFRFSAGWRGRRGILLSLLGFVVILFTFIEVQHK